MISPGEELAGSLAKALTAVCTVTAVRPGARMLHVLRDVRPEVVIVDRIDQRSEGAQLEIALVKELSPRARVIALSGNSSDADASSIEQGIFCYVAAPRGDELVRLVRAAARAATAEVNWNT